MRTFPRPLSSVSISVPIPVWGFHLLPRGRKFI